MTRKRYITEMGMGVDVHGSNYTRAAERAVFDAIHHSSLNFFKALGKHPDEMEIELLIGVPEPELVDKAVVASALPYGSVVVSVAVGGLKIPGEDGADAVVIANAGVVVYLRD